MHPGQIILINKPYRWTSFDVVKKIKGALKEQLKKNAEISLPELKKIKVGHAGTLDPLATGLLVICTNSLTKKIPEIQDAEKEYTGTFFLGATTESHDLEREVKEHTSIAHITEEQILNTAQQFTGFQVQYPPVHSAVKVDGKRAYELARKGKPVVTKPKEIEVKEFQITSIRLPLVEFRIICSKGTYIRSLAHDFGKALGTGAYLASLCRTRIGTYHLEDALELSFFISQSTEKQAL